MCSSGSLLLIFLRGLPCRCRYGSPTENYFYSSSDLCSWLIYCTEFWLLPGLSPDNILGQWHHWDCFSFVHGWVGVIFRLKRISTKETISFWDSGFLYEWGPFGHYKDDRSRTRNYRDRLVQFVKRDNVLLSPNPIFLIPTLFCPFLLCQCTGTLGRLPLCLAGQVRSGKYLHNLTEWM